MIAITPQKIFFQGGSPKQATPFLRQDLLTARNRFRPNFRGWRLDENLKPKSPPYRGAHIDARWQDKNEVGFAPRAAMLRAGPDASILHCDSPPPPPTSHPARTRRRAAGCPCASASQSTRPRMPARIGRSHARAYGGPLKPTAKTT